MKNFVLFLGILLVGCSSVVTPGTVHLALPGFTMLGGQVFEPTPKGLSGDQSIPGPSINEFTVHIVRPDGQSDVIDLLEAVRNCSGSCEVPVVVKPGLNLVFDFQAFTGSGDSKKLLRRGFAVTDVEEGQELNLIVAMWPAERYSYNATGDTSITVRWLDVIRTDRSLILAAAFDSDPFEATHDRRSAAIGGKVEFDFSAMGASELGGVPLVDGFVVTHRLELYPACNRFLFAPSEISYAQVSSCGSMNIPGAGNPAVLPFQIFGKQLYVNIPYNVIGGNSLVLTDLKKGTFVAGFLPVNAGGWQLIQGAIRP